MIDTWKIFLTFVIIALTIYKWIFSGSNYFAKKGIPYIPGVPVFGNMGKIFFRKETLSDTILKAYCHNPDAKYVGFFDFSSPVIIIRDLDIMKSVMIKNFDYFPDHKMFAEEVPDSLFKDNLFSLQGKRWRDTRALLSPTFTSSKMKILFKLVKECSENLINYLNDNESEVFDVKDIFTRYTNDVILSSAFGINVNSLEDRKNIFYTTGKKATDFSGSRSFRLFILRTFPKLSKFLNVRLFEKRITNFYKNIVTENIRLRKTKNIVRPDMIQLMIQAKQEEEKFEDLKLTDDDMTAHAFIFYFGGFDTVSLILTFAVYQIAVNPDVQEKLKSEIDQVLKKCDGDFDYDSINEMKYLDAVLNETLRLHPPGTIGDRICRKKFQLPPAEPGLEPFTIEPGETVWFPFDAIHKDSKYFFEPLKFNPDRFLRDYDRVHVQDAFMPFGSGPRFCIGNRFALMEAKLLIFQILSKYDLEKSDKTDSDIKLSTSSFIPRIDGQVWINFKNRNQV